jgi:Glycosyltransferase
MPRLEAPETPGNSGRRVLRAVCGKRLGKKGTPICHSSRRIASRQRDPAGGRSRKSASLSIGAGQVPRRDARAFAPFSAADVFTLPTIYDPFSNACLEAVAAGLPVVTTTANGFSEILEPGLHGETVEPGDVKALAEALESARNWNSEKTSQACRKLAESYSIERNVQATLDLLKKNCPEEAGDSGPD